MESRKFCTKCSKWKPASTMYFHADENCNLGLKSVCKICTNYRRNKDKRFFDKEIKEKNRAKKEGMIEVYLEILKITHSLFFVNDGIKNTSIPRSESELIPGGGFMEYDMFIIPEEMALEKGFL